ncbi:MAG: hypothetical protein WC670_14280 [Pseudolabrys sp.]|jgi:hypothetical protein
MSEMCRRYVIFALVAAGLLAPAPAVRAQSVSDPYNIMAPEPGHRPQPQPTPWLPPKYQSPRNARPIPTPRAELPPAPRAAVPPSIYVPETGRVLPNLPTLSPSGPNGTETSQDKAVRCANQVGIYGAQAGNPAGYLGSCVNQ